MSNKENRKPRKFMTMRKKNIDSEADREKPDDIFVKNNNEPEVQPEIKEFTIAEKDKVTGGVKFVPDSDIDDAFQVTDSGASTQSKAASTEPTVSETFISQDLVNKKESVNEDILAPTDNASHVLEIDPDIPYFFVFGLPSSGKTAMLTGLIYYLKTIAEGQLDILNSTDKVNHKKGRNIFYEMSKHVKAGTFLPGTTAIDTTEFVFPNEMNLEFVPDDNQKAIMPFSLLDMAGEDLKDVLMKDGGLNGGELDERINSYLAHPECSLVFIMVIDINFPNESEDLIEQFLSYAKTIGHVQNPVLFAVNKWDIEKDGYDSVEDYFANNLQVLNRLRKDPKRATAVLDFSIGKVSDSEVEKDGVYTYDYKDSERLMKWMYEISTGYSFDQEFSDSIWKKIIKRFKKRQKNG
ncbi:MAG: hypothetical protein GQ574_27485 [Crocinitomix sp.]|nr:hypothetical protein [Crocinitomix sp.]